MRTYLNRSVWSRSYSFIAALSFIAAVWSASGSVVLSEPHYSSGVFSFKITGPPNSRCEVYQSSSLAGWTWVESRNLDSTGINQFSSGNLGGQPCRFYRVTSGNEASDAIGFTRIEVQGGKSEFIANQLINGGNDINQIQVEGPASDPNGLLNAVLSLWNGSTYSSYSFFTDADASECFGQGFGDGWYNGSGELAQAALNPGMSAFVDNHQAGSVTLTMVGSVPTVVNETLTVNPGYNLLSFVVPVTASLDDFHFPGNSDPDGINNDVLNVWDSAGNQYRSLSYFKAADADINFGQNSGDGWYDSSGTRQSDNPVYQPKVGRGFLLLRNGTGLSWEQHYLL